jgi:hypothetical protein
MPTEDEAATLSRLGDGRPVDLDGRTLRPDVLRAACTAPDDLVKTQIAIVNARVIDDVDLAGSRLEHGLLFVNCAFARIVMSRGVSKGPIEFVECELRELIADRFVTHDDIVIRRGRAERLVLDNAEIGDDLRICGSALRQPGGIAIDVRDAVIEGTLFVKDCQVDGGIDVTSCYVGQDLDLRDSVLRNRGAAAIDAAYLEVRRDLIGEGAEVHGQINLRWARVHRMRFRGASVNGPAVRPGDDPGSSRAESERTGQSEEQRADAERYAIHADGLLAAGNVHLDQGFRSFGTIRLVGARINGELIFTDAVLEADTRWAVEADRLSARDIYLDGKFQSTGGISLVGATVERQLNCTGARMNSHGATDPALNASGMVCSGSILLNGNFRARGEVRLVGATARQELNCASGTFESRSGSALDADGMTTDGNVLLNHGFHATGEVRLSRATIGRQLDCEGGQFTGCGEIALDVSGMVGHGDVLLTDGFRATAEVRMRDARLDRDLKFTGGRLAGHGDSALDARGTSVGGCLELELAEPPGAPLDLSYVSVNRLKDEPRSWTGPPSVLNGLVYQTIEDQTDTADEVDVNQRIETLRRMRRYKRQPYQELANFYRRAGREKHARKVAIAGLRELRKEDGLNWWGRRWNGFLELTVGYGYQFWRLALVVVVATIINFFVYNTAAHNDLIEPNSVSMRTATAEQDPSSGSNRSGDSRDVETTHALDLRCAPGIPCFSPLTYSIHLLIPVVSLQQFDTWKPVPEGGWGIALVFWTWLMILVGWLLGAGLVAGLNIVLREH